MEPEFNSSTRLAESLTKAASMQSYYIVRWLVDAPLRDDAYRAYGYFRWLDDRLDGELMSKAERLALVTRQHVLVDCSYLHQWPALECEHEQLLVELIQSDPTRNSGLELYICNLMAVMAFDAERRGRLISQHELGEYTRLLALAVTEALHYFIGHNSPSPVHPARYQAASAAHITHMLRDTVEDNAAGYFNIPREYLEAHGIRPNDLGSPAYREWVRERVALARAGFAEGRWYLTQVKNWRCRLAGYTYMARFTNVLSTIEREDYYLRAAYPECKRLSTVLLRTLLPRAWSMQSEKG